MAFSSTQGGKGCARRPSQVDSKALEDNWDRIFGKKDKPSTPVAQKPEQEKTK